MKPLSAGITEYNILTDCIYLKKSLMQIMTEINNISHIDVSHFMIVDLRCIDILSLSMDADTIPRIYLSSLGWEKLSSRIADITIDLHKDIDAIKNDMIRIMGELTVHERDDNTLMAGTMRGDLTSVENITLEMLSSGHSINAIAKIQKVSAKTIYSRISNVKEKLSVRTTYELLHQISFYNVRF